jgi:hypothetical protein
MKTVVWKHQLPGVANTLRLTRGAKILHLAEQHGALCLWEAHEDGENAVETRTFEILGTGHPGDVDPARFVGTVLRHGGAYVFHLFETTPAGS